MAANPLHCSILAGFALLAGCSKPDAPAPAVPEVSVVVVQPVRLPVVRSFVGRISAIRSAEVRARVAGVVQKREYTEGTDVRTGDVLFLIDPAPYRAALQEKQAALAQARATEVNDQTRAKRYRDLATSGVVARQDLDDANAQANTGEAAVQQAVAAVERARLDLAYTTVRAPIAGRAGKALVTEGALVGEGDATHLTTVEQIDQVYVDFNQSVSELESLRRLQASGAVELAAQKSQRVRVLYEDGSEYPHEGSLSFEDLAVAPSTGAVSLRAVLPNPERRLLPGMFVRVALQQGERQNVYVVPQEAVQRDASGLFAFVVGADGKAQQRPLQTQGMEGGNWVVIDGLQPGEQVVVSGIQRVSPGAAVKAVVAKPAAEPAAKPAPAAAAGG